MTTEEAQENKEQQKLPIKAIIFDFDGLLVDTETLRIEAYRELFNERGIEFDLKEVPQILGKTGFEAMKYLKDKYGLEEATEDLLAKRREIFQSLFENRLALMEGVEELLDRVKNWNVACAIASGSRRRVVLDGLKRLGIQDRFSVIITSEDLEGSPGKPDPDIYLIVAKKLNVNPSSCLVLEDAPNGIESAKAAGMKVIYVPDARYVDTYHDKADLILKSLHELTDEVMYKLAH